MGANFANGALFEEAVRAFDLGLTLWFSCDHTVRRVRCITPWTLDLRSAIAMRNKLQAVASGSEGESDGHRRAETHRVNTEIAERLTRTRDGAPEHRCGLLAIVRADLKGRLPTGMSPQLL